MNRNSLALCALSLLSCCPLALQGQARAVSHLTRPLAFTSNAGQTDPKVKFVAQGKGYTLFMTPQSVVFSFYGLAPQRTVPPANTPTVAATLQMTLQNSNLKPTIEGVGAQANSVNCYLGNDPKQWRTNIPNYTKVRYRQVYPGIDLVYYGSQNQLEYDFVVAPKANPKQIALKFQGADALALDKEGGLRLKLAGKTVRWHKPFVYQETAGKKQPIAASYVVHGNQVGFRLAAYDRRKPLTIDPVLDYSTYFGGNSDEYAYGVAADGKGNVYVTGPTHSFDFPTLNPAQPAHGAGYWNGYVSKFSPKGDLMWSTYLGGDGGDESLGLALDRNNNVYVTGYTYSRNFPRTAGVYQSVFTAAQSSGYITKFNANGVLQYSTLYSGDFREWGERIAVSSTGEAYITGFSASFNLPTTPGAYRTQRLSGYWNTYVAKFNTTATQLVYATFIGGTKDSRGQALAVDSVGNAIVGGSTTSRNFPVTSGAYQTIHKGAILYKSINANTNPMTWTASESGLNGHQIQTLAIDPLTPSILYAAQEDGLYKTTNSGAAWTLILTNTNYINRVIVDPVTPTNVYVVTYNTVYRSINGGASWVNSGDSFNGYWGNSLAIDPTAPATLYAATDNGVYKSNSAGAAWVFSGAGLPNNGNGYYGVFAIAVDPRNVTTLFAGTNYGMYKSTNAGASWFAVNSGLPYNGTVPYPIRVIAVNPFNSSIVYIKSDYNNSLLKSINGGSTWNFTPINNVATVVCDPVNTNVVYAGNYNGVHKSVNNANSFGNPTLFKRNVNALVIDPTNTARVYAGSFLGWDGYVTKLNADGSDLIYSTYIGGARHDYIEHLAIDRNDNIYIIGETESEDFALINPMVAAQPGYRNAMLVKLDPSGSPIYATYFGSTNYENAYSIAADSFGNAYLSGFTYSSDFPVTPDALQPFAPGDGDGFLAKISHDGSTLLYGSYLGGENYDYSKGIAADDGGNIFVIGHTQSTEFPVANAFQSALNGGSDAFLTKIKMTASLRVTPTIVRNGNNLDVTLALANVGELDIANVRVSNAKLNTSTTTTGLPLVVGTMLIGQNETVTLRFAGAAGAPGSRAVLRLTGSYTGGTFGGTYRVTLP